MGTDYKKRSRNSFLRKEAPQFLGMWSWPVVMGHAKRRRWQVVASEIMIEQHGFMTPNVVQVSAARLQLRRVDLATAATPTACPQPPLRSREAMCGPIRP